MPQQIIDEESRPGVLADMFRTAHFSGSLDTSNGSSNSDKDGSSASRTTAERIKKAFSHRKHWRSSNSSNGVRPSPNRVTSGQKERIDGDEEPFGDCSYAEDFECGNMATSESLEANGDIKELNARMENPRNAGQDDDNAVEIPEKEAVKTTEQTPTPNHNPQVGSSEEIVPEQDRIGPKPPFGIFELPAGPTLRPAISKALSNTVFATCPSPYNSPLPHSSAPQTKMSGSRHTDSLPNRLQSTTRMWNVSPRGPIPPSHSPLADPECIIDSGNERDKSPQMSRTAAIVLMLISTALVALCAESLVGAIPDITAKSTISQMFVGLIILPIVGNVAEHVTAVTVAMKNKMDLAIGVAVGSSIQIGKRDSPTIQLYPTHSARSHFRYASSGTSRLVPRQRNGPVLHPLRDHLPLRYGLCGELPRLGRP